MQDEHGSEATGRVGRNRPTERDCLTSSTRYSAFSVQVQSMGVCGCVECAGPGAVGVWCVDVCVHWVCVQCVCRVDKSRQLQGEINAGRFYDLRPFSLQSTTLVSCVASSRVVSWKRPQSSLLLVLILSLLSCLAVLPCSFSWTHVVLGMRVSRAF